MIYSPNEVDRRSLHSYVVTTKYLSPSPQNPPKTPFWQIFQRKTYYIESAPLVPREWSYEAENLQLYRYRQVLAHVSKFLR